MHLIGTGPRGLPGTSGAVGEWSMPERSMSDSWTLPGHRGIYRFMHRWHLAPEEEGQLVWKPLARGVLEQGQSRGRAFAYQAMHDAICRYDGIRRSPVASQDEHEKIILADLLDAVENGSLVAIQEDEPPPPGWYEEEPVPEPEPVTETEPRWFEVRVVWDDTNEPVTDLPLVVDPGRGALFLETDANGRIRLENITSGSCECRSSFRGVRYDECALFAGDGDAERTPVKGGPSAPRQPRAVVEVRTLKVRTGNSLQGIAESINLNWRDLAYFNWGTKDLEKVNKHLVAEVGCTKKQSNGKPYPFSDADVPGTLLVPRQWRQPGLATGRVHVLRVRPPELRFGRCINAAHEAIADRPYRIFKNGKQVHDGLTDASGWILAPFKYDKQYSVRFHHADFDTDSKGQR